jgi:pimeloyl-ACP methyl ester carboxylesterase
MEVVMKGKFIINRKRRIFDLFILLALPIFFYSCVDSMIFHPPKCSYNTSRHLITISTADSQRIVGLYWSAEPHKYVILLSHGNAEDIGQLRDHIQRFKIEGSGILAYDYRGFGLSEGKATERNTYEDIEAVYRYLTNEQGVDPHQIIVHGRSVGCGPSVWLAEQYPVGGLILESPFLSAFRVFTRWPILPFDKYNNLSRIKDVHCPLLVIHGEQDKIVPFWHGETIYKEANHPKMHYWVEDAGHNDLISLAGKDYWKTLNDFKKLLTQSQNNKSVSDAN